MVFNYIVVKKMDICCYDQLLFGELWLYEMPLAARDNDDLSAPESYLAERILVIVFIGAKKQPSIRA